MRRFTRLVMMLVMVLVVVSASDPVIANDVNTTLDRAVESLLAGDSDLARDLAMDIWLSSAPHEARQRAWKIIMLAEDDPALLPEGHRVWLEAPGGRDHPRFDRWLHETYVQPYDWVLSLEINYVPTLISEGRAGETAYITFVLDDGEWESTLLELLDRTGQEYRTDQWFVLSKVPLHTPQAARPSSGT